MHYLDADLEAWAKAPARIASADDRVWAGVCSTPLCRRTTAHQAVIAVVASLAHTYGPRPLRGGFRNAEAHSQAGAWRALPLACASLVPQPCCLIPLPEAFSHISAGNIANKDGLLSLHPCVGGQSSGVRVSEVR